VGASQPLPTSGQADILTAESEPLDELLAGSVEGEQTLPPDIQSDPDIDILESHRQLRDQEI
jgi:hypothetical protein